MGGREGNEGEINIFLEKGFLVFSSDQECRRQLNQETVLNAKGVKCFLSCGFLC